VRAMSNPGEAPTSTLPAKAGVRKMTTMLDAALAHAKAGRQVFPVHTIRNGACTCGGGKGCSPGKHPSALLPRAAC
jgi:hypothetical protein